MKNKLIKLHSGMFKKGHKPMGRSLVGHSTSDETKRKISLKHTGKKLSEETKKKIGRSGCENSNWKGGITKSSKKIYNTSEYKKWKKDLLEHYNYRCVDCGNTKNLEAHHIISKKFKEIMLHPFNGVILCKNCHKKTDNYAGKNKENYEITDGEFFIISKTIPSKWQYYETAGNYFFTSKGDIIIFVSEWTREYEFLIMIHEMVEAFLTRKRGIPEESISKFDIEFNKKDLPGEPGDHKDAPYRKEHHFAEKIEKLLAKELGINWKKYDAMGYPGYE